VQGQISWLRGNFRGRQTFDARRRRAAQEDGLDGSSPRIMRRARPQSPFLVGLSRETDTRDHSSTSADAPPPPSLVKILIAAHS
jgi:hypothetical protein